MYFKIIALTLVIVQTCAGEKSSVLKKGPFSIPDWETPKFSDFTTELQIDTLIYQESLEGKVMSARGWQFSYNWHFWARYSTQEKSIYLTPKDKEGEEWASKGECLVGTSYDTTGDDECWKDLTTVERKEWIKPRFLDRQMPDKKGFQGTCARKWSCDSHDVLFPIYIMDDGTFEPYVSGPHGETIRVSGSGEVRSIPMQDSVFIYKTVEKSLHVEKLTAHCLQSALKEAVEIFCQIEIKDRTVAVKFDSKSDRRSFNNYVFYKPPSFSRSPHLLTRRVGAPADPATKGDLKQVEDKLGQISMQIIFEYHSLLVELADIKHVLREMVLSGAKTDDNLIGKLTNLPVKTTWLSDEIFLLNSNYESLIHAGTLKDNTSCAGSYVYENGRWALKYPDQFTCSEWGNVTALGVFGENLYKPTFIGEGLDYRNASSEYTGWTYLDNGRISLDWLGHDVKYRKGDGLFDFLSNLQLPNILGGLSTTLVIIVIVFLLVSCVCKR